MLADLRGGDLAPHVEVWTHGTIHVRRSVQACRNSSGQPGSALPRFHVSASLHSRECKISSRTLDGHPRLPGLPFPPAEADRRTRSGDRMSQYACLRSAEPLGGSPSCSPDPKCLVARRASQQAANAAKRTTVDDWQLAGTEVRPSRCPRGNRRRSDRVQAAVNSPGLSYCTYHQAEPPSNTRRHPRRVLVGWGNLNSRSASNQSR